MTFAEALFLIQSATRTALTKKDLWYVVEATNWAIKNVGEHITEQLNQKKLLSARITATPRYIRNSLIHFGSLHTLSWHGKPRAIDHSNTIVTTVFHLIPDKKSPAQLQELLATSKKIHTASTRTKKDLIKAGVSAERIQVIPLGIDTKLFQPISSGEKKELRQKLKIPADRFVIGSFQKDGVGWSEGLDPKLEKGPDIFVKVIQEVAAQYPIHVLLTGPSRGYVKKELTRVRIPFTDIGYLPRYESVARYYQALDAYLIASRIEGGPLSVLEAWASHVPVISTRVGMVPDIAEHNIHALLAESEDVTRLAQNVATVLNEPEQSALMTDRASQHVQRFDWSALIQEYYQKLYV